MPDDETETQDETLIEEPEFEELPEPVEEPGTSGYSVDVANFDKNTLTHIGLFYDLESASDAANEIDLKPGSMVRVSPVSYFRTNLK